jgi:hypothetical protein
VTDDRHSPTSAGPTPPQPPPTTAPGGAGASGGRTVPTVAGIDPSERPEILVGAAFAGGFLAAMILKRLGG